MASEAQKFIRQHVAETNDASYLNNINKSSETKAEYMARVFKFLVDKAIRQETTCYEDIAKAVGLPTTGNQLSMTLSVLLTDIFEWCEERRLPMLTSIVVRKSGQDQGLPGKGFWILVENKFLKKKDGEEFQFENIVLESRHVRKILLQSYQTETFNYWKMMK